MQNVDVQFAKLVGHVRTSDTAVLEVWVAHGKGHALVELVAVCDALGRVEHKQAVVAKVAQVRQTVLITDEKEVVSFQCRRGIVDVNDSRCVCRSGLGGGRVSLKQLSLTSKVFLAGNLHGYK